MNILDAHKLEADIRVVVLILIAFPCRTIRQCVQLRKHKKCSCYDPPTSLKNTQKILCSCGSMVEHCVSNAKGYGFDSQGTRILIKKHIAWMHRKSLWIKVSAKCINVKQLWYSTLGRVSITYMYRLLWLALLMAWSMCSSSKHRALKPERGWLHRHTAAWRHDTNKYKMFTTLKYIIKAE